VLKNKQEVKSMGEVCYDKVSKGLMEHIVCKKDRNSPVLSMKKKNKWTGSGKQGV